MREFTFKGTPFVVKHIGTEVKYKDKNHLGGPWSSVILTLQNSSVDSKFKALLRASYASIIH
jgi:hypothetical protein